MCMCACTHQYVCVCLCVCVMKRVYPYVCVSALGSYKMGHHKQSVILLLWILTIGTLLSIVSTPQHPTTGQLREELLYFHRVPELRGHQVLQEPGVRGVW